MKSILMQVIIFQIIYKDKEVRILFQSTYSKFVNKNSENSLIFRHFYLKYKDNIFKNILVQFLKIRFSYYSFYCF